MTSESSRQTMNRFVEFINTADPKMADDLVSPDAIFHVPGQAEPMRGPSGYLSIIAMMRSGFPDIQWTLDDLVAEGDKVAARYTMRGTHSGSFMGVPPTGKSIVVKSMAFYRLSNGQFIEEQGLPDMLELMRQIGAVPNP